MTNTQYALLFVQVVAISIGQVLFKYAAASIDVSSKGIVHGFLFNAWLVSALILYAGATLLWLYILRITPLRTAYPFAALAFLLVPILASFLLNEPLRWTTFGSAFFIIIGVWISTL